MKNNAPETSHAVKVWDAPTRLFHWVLVILVALSAYSAFQDKFGIYADIHLWSGYGVLTLVGWRLIWGLIGSDSARFSHFIKGPVATISYAKTAFKKAPYRWVGHNPMGAVSVVAMLVLLAVQASLGLFATDDMFFAGPLSDTVSGSLAGDITGLHELTGFTLFGLIALHVLVIAFMAIRRRSNLLLPMITGWKKDAPAEALPPRLRSPLLAFVVLLAVGAALYFYIFR